MVTEYHYRWEYDLASPPEALWPLVADTNRFNRDTGLPRVEMLPSPPGAPRPLNARRRLRLKYLGMNVEWEEEPFQWVRPLEFGVTRTYATGPIRRVRMRAELRAAGAGGTRLSYQVWAQPRGLLGRLVIPAQIGWLSAGRFARVFHEYDRLAALGDGAAVAVAPAPAGDAALEPGGRERLESGARALVEAGIDPALARRLVDLIAGGDPAALARMRPHALADDFGAAPRAMLELFLHATRAGLLTLRWNVLCPHCRGAKQSVASLDALSRETVCDTCDIRFDATFDQHVELTFQPSPAVRETWTAEFCVAGPEMTPHVAAQQLLAPGEERVIALSLPPGAYRLRALEAPLSRAVVVEEGGAGAADAPLFPDESWPQGPLRLAPAPAALALRLVNGAAREHLFIIERTAWVEHAVTAAEATSMQTFRDLFSSEAIRPGQEISVGRMAILFTDLRGSTRMYRQIGDAPAFSLVMTHFDVLRRAVAMADGAIVKTIGDAVMGVFQRPLNAITCMLRAQAELAAPAGGAAPLTLKAGIHAGPCIAVTLNDRLDYFGSTVNLAARLEGLSSGGDLIISDAVRRDPEVAAAIDSPGGEIRAEPFGAGLKGFDDERFDLWRVTLREAT